ncbi:MAG: hypothetical protein ACFFCO_12865 [Promethearchaeota archaeon]
MTVTFSGTGTQDDPIQISGVTTNTEGVRAEYVYLSERFGQRGQDWTLERQALIKLPSGGMGDLMIIKLADSQIVEVYFDISSFFGKW